MERVTREASLVTNPGEGRERKSKKRKIYQELARSKGQSNLQASSRWSWVLFKHSLVVTAGACWD